jgi:hypothetical protein
MTTTTFDVHPGVAMVKKWADELPAKTGRTLDQWAEVVRRCGRETVRDRAAWLKGQHGFASNTAWWIAEYAADSATWEGDPEIYLRQAAGYVEGMFAGAKAGLRPIFEALVAAARELGGDVKVCPCKTIVPFYRSHVFAQVKPATRTRLEFAVAIGDRRPTGKLRPNPRAKGNDRLTHLFELSAEKDVTPEVRKWLKIAYDADA